MTGSTKELSKCSAIRPERRLWLSKCRRSCAGGTAGPIYQHVPRAVQHLVAKYLAEANITRASVHTLRHTFATHHVALGTSLRTVQEVLGHASLKTTSIYVQLAQEAVKRELQEHAL